MLQRWLRALHHSESKSFRARGRRRPFQPELRGALGDRRLETSPAERHTIAHGRMLRSGIGTAAWDSYDVLVDEASYTADGAPALRPAAKSLSASLNFWQPDP